MSFTDALRDQMEIEPRETREQFMLRYAGMRPVGENMTLAHWVQKVALASSLGHPQAAQDMIWSGTVYHLHQAMAATVGHVLGTYPLPANDVVMALTMGLVGHQENLRSVRLHAPHEVQGVNDIDPERLAPLVLQDMTKASALYDQLQSVSRER